MSKNKNLQKEKKLKHLYIMFLPQKGKAVQPEKAARLVLPIV